MNAETLRWAGRASRMGTANSVCASLTSLQETENSRNYGSLTFDMKSPNLKWFNLLMKGSSRKTLLFLFLLSRPTGQVIAIVTPPFVTVGPSVTSAPRPSSGIISITVQLIEVSPGHLCSRPLGSLDSIDGELRPAQSLFSVNIQLNLLQTLRLHNSPELIRIWEPALDHHPCPAMSFVSLPRRRSSARVTPHKDRQRDPIPVIDRQTEARS